MKERQYHLPYHKQELWRIVRGKEISFRKGREKAYGTQWRPPKRELGDVIYSGLALQGSQSPSLAFGRDSESGRGLGKFYGEQKQKD